MRLNARGLTTFLCIGILLFLSACAGLSPRETPEPTPSNLFELSPERPAGLTNEDWAYWQTQILPAHSGNTLQIRLNERFYILLPTTDKETPLTVTCDNPRVLGQLSDAQPLSPTSSPDFRRFGFEVASLGLCTLQFPPTGFVMNVSAQPQDSMTAARVLTPGIAAAVTAPPPLSWSEEQNAQPGLITRDDRCQTVHLPVGQPITVLLPQSNYVDTSPTVNCYPEDTLLEDWSQVNPPSGYRTNSFNAGRSGRCTLSNNDGFYLTVIVEPQLDALYHEPTPTPQPLTPLDPRYATLPPEGIIRAYFEFWNAREHEQQFLLLSSEKSCYDTLENFLRDNRDSSGSMTIANIQPYADWLRNPQNNPEGFPSDEVAGRCQRYMVTLEKRTQPEAEPATFQELITLLKENSGWKLLSIGNVTGASCEKYKD